jgi:hypothetical protein
VFDTLDASKGTFEDPVGIDVASACATMETALSSSGYTVGDTCFIVLEMINQKYWAKDANQQYPNFPGSFPKKMRYKATRSNGAWSKESGPTEVK